MSSTASAGDTVVARLPFEGYVEGEVLSARSDGYTILPLDGNEVKEVKEHAVVSKDSS